MFPSHPDCARCPLHKEAESVGIPTRPWLPPKHLPAALLFVGEAPGKQEDREACSWVGPAGNLAARILEKARLSDHADIYLSNACRCYPGSYKTPQKSHIVRCRLWLHQDIRILSDSYKTLYLIALGGPASMSLVNTPLKSLLNRQGQFRPLHPLPKQDSPSPVDGLQFPVFGTYHPAFLFPGRSPSSINAVRTHMQFLHSVVSGERKIADPSPLPPRALPPPLPLPPLLSLDIETYGILSGMDQTVFHPAKSEIIDGIPPDKQIVTAALSWVTRDGIPRDEIQSTIFLWSSFQDRYVLYKWLRAARDSGSTILGKGIVYDLLYLRYCDDILRACIRPPMRFDDIGIINYLDYDLRPERSLKPLAAIFGAADYSSLSVNARAANLSATSPTDPDLWRYNATDSEAALRLYPWFRASILKTYGSSSSKLSPLSSDFRNQTIWTILRMSEAGVTFNENKLSLLHSDCESRMKSLQSEAAPHNLPLSGPGSDKAKRDLLWQLIQGHFDSDPRIQYTKKRRDIAISKDNIDYLTSRTADPRLHLVAQHTSLSKVVSSYTKPLLSEPRKGIVRSVRGIGYSYPSWMPVPFTLERGGKSDREAGTIQGRYSCNRPAAQTFPPSVKECLSSRWRDGSLLIYDYAQMELRIFALLSGDPLFLTIFREGRDPHVETAFDMQPGLSPSDESFPRLRQASKTLNFLTIYRGGPKKFQSQLREKASIEMPLEECRSWIDRFWPRHRVAWDWQESLIRLAKRQGYLELLTGWGRTFSGGSAAIDETYINEICNLPVQCYAAQICQSAQYAIQEELDRRNLRTLNPKQDHDSITFDVFPGELDEVRSLSEPILTRPSLAVRLFEHLGREIPLVIESEVK